MGTWWLNTAPVSRRRLIFSGLLAGLLFAELGLRLIGAAPGYRFPSFRITDDRFTGRANEEIDGNGVHYAFDENGFRRSAGLTPDDGLTVLFLGDSFTQGFGVDAEQTFPAFACARLIELGLTARCLNAGTSGFGTAHELRILRRLLARPELSIDAVVFQLLPNNDLRDNWEDGGFAVEEGRLVERVPPAIPWPVRLRDALFDNDIARSSRIVSMVANATMNGVGLAPDYDESVLELQARLLEEVVATARQRRIPIVVVVAATQWELQRQRTEPFDERDRLDRVAAAVSATGVPWIDSRTVNDREDLYIPNDGHFSAAGNRRIGIAIADQLAPQLRSATAP